MTLTSLLLDLRHATFALRAIDMRLIQVEEHSRKLLLLTLPKKQRPFKVHPETFAMHPVRAILNTIVADVTAAVGMVGLYATVLQGKPLGFKGFDEYSSDMERDAEAPLREFFHQEKNVISGLEGLLREAGGGAVSDEEVFATYRAIGCQSFSMWEVSVHRLVGGACAETAKLARDVLGVDEDSEVVDGA